MKNIYILLIILISLNSCSGMSDAKKVLRNEKIKTTDEFLVKKRNPLVLPPNFEEIPKPGTKPSKNENEEDKIKKILKGPKTDNTQSSKSKSVEESILKRIRK
tara:strand:- start:243 stop:551 length:309 start_codon:yes stop_codon:yes gene_type:complete